MYDSTHKSLDTGVYLYAYVNIRVLLEFCEIREFIIDLSLFRCVLKKTHTSTSNMCVSFCNSRKETIDLQLAKRMYTDRNVPRRMEGGAYFSW